MACANPECGCNETRPTRHGSSYCSDECETHAEVSALGSQPTRSSERSGSQGCGCGHAACAGPA